MPLRYTYRFRSGELALWELAEEDAFFLRALDLSEIEEQELSSLPFGKRRSEWLASRYLLQLIDGPGLRRTLLRLPSGRPVFAEGKGYCSLSHSGKWVAAAVSKKPVGIDVQRIESRILRLSAKFMRGEEIRTWEQYARKMEVYTLYWAGKEAVYKAADLRAVDFKRDLHLPLQKLEESGELVAELYRGQGKERALHSSWCLRYRLHRDLAMVVATIC